MSQRSAHTPGTPKSPKPPEGLVKIANSLSSPDVTRVGLTTTNDGQWALMVRVRSGAETPVKDVEEVCRDYPVVYQDEPEELPVARPAYPALGE